MAKDKKSPSEQELLLSETNKNIIANHYGLTPNFMSQYEDDIKRVETKVKASLRSSNDDNPDKIFDTMRQLQHITSATFQTNDLETSLKTGGPLTTPYMTEGGFRAIYGENENKEDTELFNLHSLIFSNYRNLVSEYRNIGRLIPEVHRCADMKSRDILAINEITKRSISNVYVAETNNANEQDPVNLKNNPINKKIEEDILDKYDVENKIPKYIMTSLIEGSKPVVIYPFKDILTMTEHNNRQYAKQFDDYNMKVSRGTEDFNSIMLEYHSKSNKLIPDMSDPKFKIFSTEDGHEVFDSKNYTAYRDMIVNQFCSTEDFNEYLARGYEDVSETLNKNYNEELLSVYASNTIDKTVKINETKEKFRELQAAVKVDGALSEQFKEQIFNAVRKIDTNIEFFDQSEAPMAMAIDNFRRLAEFTAYHEDPASGIMAYGVNKQKKYNRPDSTVNQDSLDKFNKNTEPKSVLDDYEDEFSTDSKSLLNDCLIKEYDAEDVIPVIISGKHVGYYVIETAPYTGNVESVNKRNNNFTDMFINLGMNNDMAISPGPNANGTFGSGLQGAPMGGVGPMADASSIGVTGSMALGTGLNIANFDMTGAGTEATRRNNIMKKIMFNILKQKLKRKDLHDDEPFTETIMALIRDGAIVENKIKIIYVPEKYMCYFTPGLDGNGIPQSFLKDCLFTCYEKILINMNNIMTRLTRTGTRDKVTVNVGKAKNIGATIRSIENALTTRKLNVESPFTSLSRVLKAASLSETIIVPVFDGNEKLFEYEDLSQTNVIQPDDTMEEKLTNQIITALKCPITIMNPYQEEDFASIAASRNAEYRFDIIKLQQVYTKTITKFLKLLIVGSGLHDELKKGNNKFDLKNVKPVLSPPENLNMKNANEIFSTVSSYIDNIVGIIINPDDDTELTRQLRYEFKKKMYQRLAPGFNLDEYITIADALERNAIALAIEKKKKDAVNDHINNTDFKAMVVGPDGEITEAGNSGTGNADDSGW